MDTSPVPNPVPDTHILTHMEGGRERERERERENVLICSRYNMMLGIKSSKNMANTMRSRGMLSTQIIIINGKLWKMSKEDR